MTFDALENSRASGKPVILYKFTVGLATPLTFTDATTTITYDDGGGSEPYVPIPIQMDEITANGTLDKNERTILVPDDIALTTDFLRYPPPEPVSVIARFGHQGDAEFKLAFTGVVLSITRKAGFTELACEPVSSALRRPGLRRNYQYSCPYVLYQGLCTASKAAATSSVVVDAIVSTNLIVPTGWNGANLISEYLGGTVEWTNADGNTEVRTILNATATQLSLSGLVRDLAVSDSVNVVLGCNRTEENCLNLHNVIAAFGGFTFIPNDTPFPAGINYYY